MITFDFSWFINFSTSQQQHHMIIHPKLFGCREIFSREPYFVVVSSQANSFGETFPNTVSKNEHDH